MTGSSLYLVDASPYIFRAYFAVPATITAEGRPVNAAYGFASFLLQIFRQEDLGHLAVAFDRSLTTSFRNEIYPDYKAQRSLPPAELEAQIDDCVEVADALGAATFSSVTHEADDLVGSLAARFRDRFPRTVIVSGDKDLTQLLDDDRTVLLDFARKRWFDAGAVRETFGVDPGQIVDYLGLVGDAVDNIPGVKGIGKKTAQALLAEYGTLDRLYDDLERVADLPLRGAASIRDRLARGRDQGFLSRRLATIVRDLDLSPVEIEDLRYKGADPEKVERTFSRLGFGTIRARIRMA